MGSNPISRLIFLFFLPISIFSLELSGVYFSDKTAVYSDIIGDKSAKFLFDFNSSFVQQMPKKKILSLLKSKGINATTMHNIVYFYHFPPKTIAFIKKELTSFYKTLGVNIQEILLKPSQKQLSRDIISIELQNKDTIKTRSKGTLEVLITSNFGKEKLSFFYEIRGTQDLLYAKEDIKRTQVLSPVLTYTKPTPIKPQIDKLLTNINDLEAKSNIKKDSIISERNTKKAYAIRKNDTVTAIFHENGVHTTFTLTAKQNGYKNDEILLENKDKKRFYGIIIDSKNVQIK